MALSQEQFDALVLRLQGKERRAPARYRFEAAALAALGYVALSAWILGLFSFIILCVWLALIRGVAPFILAAVVPGAMLIGTLKRFRSASAPPGGIPLTREEAPELYARIDRFREALRAPAVTGVKITAAFDAAIVAVPTFGVFWPRYFLTIGLPLFESLPVEEFEAVLAHEIGHLSRQDGRFGAWIYRLRFMFAALQQMEYQARTKRRSVIGVFLDWYVPYFNAYTFVLARGQEYEADRVSAAVAGKDAAARALARIAVFAPVFNDGIGSLFQSAANQLDPPVDPHLAVMRSFESLLSTDRPARRKKEALLRRTHNGDTHPSLTERLAELGAAATTTLSVPAMPRPSAFERLLSESAALVLKNKFQEMIQGGFDGSWRARYARDQGYRKRREELLTKLSAQGLSEAEALELPELEAALCLRTEAAARLRAMLARTPNDPRVHWQLGGVLLADDDASGVEHLVRCADLDPKASIPALARACDYLERIGDFNSAAPLRDRLRERSEVVALARAERARIDEDDEFLSHGLDGAVLSEIVRRVDRQDLKRAFVVRRAVRFLPEDSAYLLAVEVADSLFRPARLDARQRIVQELVAPGLPNDFLVITLDGRFAALRDSLEAVPNSVVWARKRSFSGWVGLIVGWFYRVLGIVLLLVTMRVFGSLLWEAGRLAKLSDVASALLVEFVCVVGLVALYRGRITGKVPRRFLAWIGIFFVILVGYKAGFTDTTFDGEPRAQVSIAARGAMLATFAAMLGIAYWRRRPGRT